METLRQIMGDGWLKAPDLGATTAHYTISVCRRKTGPKAGEYVVAGAVSADASVLIEASCKRARLTLEDGSSFNIMLLARSGREAEFELLPPFRSLVAL